MIISGFGPVNGKHGHGCVAVGSKISYEQKSQTRHNIHRETRPRRHASTVLTAYDNNSKPGVGSAVAELGGGASELDIARHDEDIAPKKVAAIDGAHYFVSIDPHIAPDLRAPHRRGRPVVVV